MPESITVITLLLSALNCVPLQAIFDRDSYESLRGALPGPAWPKCWSPTIHSGRGSRDASLIKLSLLAIREAIFGPLIGYLLYHQSSKSRKYRNLGMVQTGIKLSSLPSALRPLSRVFAPIWEVPVFTQHRFG